MNARRAMDAPPAGARVYQVTEPGEEAPDVEPIADRPHYVDEACDIEDHRPCDLNVAVGYVAELVEAQGLTVPAFQTLLQEGYQSDEQVYAALEAVKAAATGKGPAEIDQVLGFLRDGENGNQGSTPAPA